MKRRNGFLLTCGLLFIVTTVNAGNLTSISVSPQNAIGGSIVQVTLKFDRPGNYLPLWKFTPSFCKIRVQQLLPPPSALTPSKTYIYHVLTYQVASEENFEISAQWGNVTKKATVKITPNPNVQKYPVKLYRVLYRKNPGDWGVTSGFEEWKNRGVEQFHQNNRKAFDLFRRYPVKNRSSHKCRNIRVKYRPKCLYRAIIKDDFSGNNPIKINSSQSHKHRITAGTKCYFPGIS